MPTTSTTPTSGRPASRGASAETHMNDDAILAPSDTFLRRHLGPDAAEIAAMLQTLELSSLDALTDAAVPPAIRTDRPLDLPDPRSEFQALADLRQLASRNRVMRSMIGQGYHDTITPPVIQRNVLENPGWYTQYTPYQAEIAQGRLEALLNFQTMVSELTALPLANASLLDEATSAAEAMLMCHAIAGAKTGGGFYVSECCHPQTIAVVQSRAQSLGLAVTIGDERSHDFDAAPMFGVLLQYPDTDGVVGDDRDTIARVHAAGGLVVMAADLLALTMITPPGELGADIAVGSTQRFGVPMGFGGPHAGYLATQPTHVRRMPGRLIGVSRDATGRAALRMAIQTREQHIKRDRATSNICTAQVLLAIMAAMYAVYHGPDGLRRIAQRVHVFTRGLARGLESAGHRRIGDGPFFDTLRVEPVGRTAAEVIARAADLGVNLRGYDDGRSVGIACDETTTAADVTAVLRAFGVETDVASVAANAASAPATLPETLVRDDAYMTQEVFHAHHSETAMLRYLTRLQSRDLSLAQSMIPLGSCTMKLNATSEMLPVTWPEFGRMHPFAPVDQTAGYQTLFADLERWLGELTGFAAVSLQPNAGSQGEYAGLAVIRAYHKHRGDAARDVCLIPVSAHGTNPASAVAAGFRVVPIACDDKGNIDLDDLRAKASQHAASLGALMVTYPSTHGVFEPTIRDVCAIVHENGGQVYLDGANMNAMVGVCRPGEFGADVCHLNLHKTFCIPHGGGGPGVGPICVAPHLAPYLPSHPVIPTGGD
ncbi:MAG: aminomethyl-transferring glycine dehydrogenase, partial [Phycisphaerae bacterium]|nr:aminomethyl-transferring glycine dehydrogenase [Phycisphaerae bacterium]